MVTNLFKLIKTQQIISNCINSYSFHMSKWYIVSNSNSNKLLKICSINNRNSCNKLIKHHIFIKIIITCNFNNLYNNSIIQSSNLINYKISNNKSNNNNNNNKNNNNKYCIKMNNNNCNNNKIKINFYLKVKNKQ